MVQAPLSVVIFHQYLQLLLEARLFTNWFGSMPSEQRSATEGATPKEMFVSVKGE